MIWQDTQQRVIPSPTLEQAQIWNPVIAVPIDKLVTASRSIEQCAESIDRVQVEVKSESALCVVPDEIARSVLDLTSSQIAIPSQKQDQESEDEEMQRSPTSVVDTPLGDYVQVTFVLQPDEPPVLTRVPAGTTFRELLQAEANMQSEAEVTNETVISQRTGARVSHDFVFEENVTLVVKEHAHSIEASCVPKVEGLDEISEKESVVESASDKDEQVSPLAKLHGQAFLLLLPPQVSCDSQVSSLRAQRILASDRKVMLKNQGYIWGDDEIVWHLNRIQETCLKEMTEQNLDDDAPVFVDPMAFLGWISHYNPEDIRKWYAKHDKPDVFFTVVLNQGHWIPIIVRLQNGIVSLSFLQVHKSEQKFVDHVAARLQQIFECQSYVTHPVQCSPLSESCGAASIMFLEEYLLMQPTADTPDYDAVHRLFRYQFQENGLNKLLVSHPWMWGAGKEDSDRAQEELMSILKGHGVPPSGCSSHKGTTSNCSHWSTVHSPSMQKSKPMEKS